MDTTETSMSDALAHLEERIRSVEDRNRKVERDKAWEISLARRGAIALLTYVFALLSLSFTGEPTAGLIALVPTVGYILSALTLPKLRDYWLQYRRDGF